MKSWTQPTAEEIDKVLGRVKKETDRNYFFSRLKNPLWLTALNDREAFKSPPKTRLIQNGQIQFPFWSEMQYLINVSDSMPSEVVDILLTLPETNNPNIYDSILEIALKIEGEHSVKLKPLMLQYAELPYQLYSYKFADLIVYWTNCREYGAAIELCDKLLAYNPENSYSNETEISKKRKNKSPINSEWQYQQLLEKAANPLSQLKPYAMSCILINALSIYNDEKLKHGDLDNNSNDYSEIWCTRLNILGEYPSYKELLVLSLTFACEQVFEHDPQSISLLNEVLSKQRWLIFKRLRQHLYAKYPSDITLPWIRSLILAHKDYANSDIHFEFQQMIRSGCDIFGDSLLSEEERRTIFDTILSGPSKDEFRDWMGDKFTDEGFVKRRNFFQLKQFKPFEKILFGKYLERFQELITDEEIKISEDDYSPYKSARGGFISKQSPKPADDLAALNDSELLAYINEWQSEHRDPDNWLIEIDISALADAFKKVFITNILESTGRFAFWMDNMSEVQRPIYVRAIINAFAEQFQANKYEKIDSALNLCKWVLSHQDSLVDVTDTAGSEESNTSPDWTDSRRAVCDLIDVCLAKDSQTPISVKNDIESILESLCIQYDRRLDRDVPVFLNKRDYLSEAINNTRSRALEDLINYGYWLRRHDKDAPVDVVFDILEKRLAYDAEFKLTIPEHALLGLNFGRLAGLDEDRAKANKNYIFPKEKPEAWSAAFSNLLRYSQPYKLLFNLLEDDYRHALDFIKTVEPSEKNDRDWTDTLGQHLFSYALWQVFPFQGEESLLEQYYKNTQPQPERWARLFDHVGRSLKNTGKHIDEKLKLRVYEFVKWRLDQESKIELKDFSFWLGAECLDAEWRLDTFLAVLSICPAKDVAIYTQIEELNEMLGDHTAKVVECFAKLMQGISNFDFIYIQADKAKPILTAGLSHSDALVKGFAEQARESLLRAGHFEFLD